MRFRVPQFIDTKEKIIGPLTLQQFIWVGSGVAILFIIFQTNLPQFVIYLIAIIVLAISGMLAFFKIDGVPLPKYLVYMLSFLSGPKRYYFKKESRDIYENLGSNK